MALRELAVRRGLHVSEYGILDDATGETVRCEREEEVYERLGLWIRELREGHGELEAAAPGGPGLPDLIELDDLRGDLHCHTTASDGKATAEEMALAARELGMEYLCFTDHSPSHGFGNDVSLDHLRSLIEETRELKGRIDGIELLIGPTTSTRTARSTTRTSCRAARLGDRLRPHVVPDDREEHDRPRRRGDRAPADGRARPSDRREIESRAPYEIDIERVIEAAVKTGTMIEINASPDRRDLNENHARAAAAAGVRILVNSDAH